MGNATSNRVLLVGAEYWIGADPTCAICRPNDPFCEARHARLFRDAKGGSHVEQNKAVGRRRATTMEALKGRDSVLDRYRSHPVGVPQTTSTRTQGVALG